MQRGVQHRVVVTGMGITSALADGLAAFDEALWEGRCGIRPLLQLDTTPYSCKIGGEISEVPFEREPAAGRDRASTLALRAATEALHQSGLTPDQFASIKGGVVVGTTCGGVHSLEQVSEVLVAGGDASSIPDWRVTEFSFFAPTTHVARALQATGPVHTVAVACASGSHAVGLAMDLIRAGRAQVVLAGGVDVISRFIYRGFAALNGLGAPPYRAFDKDRAGVVLGEGAAFVMLESLEHAQARGAELHAELLGHSFNNDGAHIVNPNPTGEGIARSFRMALRDAGLTIADVDHVNTHGTGTYANDSAETAALIRVFGEDVGRVPVTSIKPMLGHTSGAAGAVELVASILCLKRGFIPPTLHFVEADAGSPLQIVATRQALALKTVVSANSGFGGSNAAVVVGQVRTETTPAALPMPEVVVTGVGVVHPEAASLDGLWARLEGPPLSGSGLPGREMAPFDVFAEAGIPVTKDARRMDVFSQLAVLATARALAASNIAPKDLDESLGLVLGSAYACLESNEKFAAGLSKVKVNPVIYQNTVSNAVTGYLCMTLGIRGPVSVLNSGTVAGAAALSYAFELIRSGRCQAVVVVGVEKLTGLTALAVERSQGVHVQGACMPYAAQDSGFQLADGAVALVLESRASAEARGARVLGKMVGYGSASAGGQTPEQAVCDAFVQAAHACQALAAGMHVYGSGSGVTQQDGWELAGIDAALEALGARATISSVKGALGETLGAAPLLGVAAGLKSLETLRARGGAAFEGRAVDVSRSGRLEPVSGEQALAVARVMVSSVDPEGDCVVIALEH